mmetsp:Transcript_66588/g.154735  ORF Transcript_66588/g.154735 Transcript_66588/m.154735 type:complete len:217 (+) Transcript_66588:69-719(+)
MPLRSVLDRWDRTLGGGPVSQGTFSVHLWCTSCGWAGPAVLSNRTLDGATRARDCGGAGPLKSATAFVPGVHPLAGARSSAAQPSTPVTVSWMIQVDSGIFSCNTGTFLVSFLVITGHDVVCGSSEACSDPGASLTLPRPRISTKASKVSPPKPSQSTSASSSSTLTPSNVSPSAFLARCLLMVPVRSESRRLKAACNVPSWMHGKLSMVAAKKSK